MSLALLCSAALVCTAPVQDEADERTFVDVDPAAVRAKIKSVDAVTAREPGCVVMLEVARPAKFDGFIEPLVLRVTPRGKGAEPFLVQRVAPPFHGRAGRAAGARAATFPVLLPLEAKAAKGAKVEVVDVSAWTGPAPRAEAPVEVGKPSTKTAFDAAMQRSLARTTVPLQNLTEHDVDVVLSADFVGPRKGTSLVAGTVPAGGALELVVAGLPTGVGEFPGAEIRRVELVDWSIRVDDGAAEAGRLFGEAWDGAYRAPRDRFPLGARFTWEYRSPKLESSRSGALRLDADGNVRVTLDGEHDAAGVRSVQADLEQALSCIARPPAAEVLEGRVSLVRRGARAVVRVEKNPLRASYDGAISFVIEAGRIFGSSLDMLASELGGGNPTVWTWKPGDPPRLSGRRDTMFRGNPQAYTALHIDWSDASGSWLPVRATAREGEWSPGMGDTTTITFDGWLPGAAELGEAAVPAGPIADELRAAWDAFYRYPTGQARIGGTFRARSPGSDGVWIGRKDVKGTFRLEDPRGAYWRESSAAIDGKRLTDDEQSVLENAVLDRVLMWSGRDLCRAPRFGEAFRGAKLERDGDWILAPGAMVPAIRIANGRVAGMRTAFGADATIRWETVEGALVPVERTCGDEVVSVKWKALEDDWLFPSRVDFERVFGRDWGPESLEFSKVKIDLED